MLTAMSGAIINVILNFAMIPDHGAMGAAVATMISYIAVYAIRAYDTANYVRFPLHTPRVILNFAALLAQALIVTAEIPYWHLLQLPILAFLLIFNGKGIVLTLGRVLGKFLKKKTKKI